MDKEGAAEIIKYPSSRARARAANFRVRDVRRVYATKRLAHHPSPFPASPPAYRVIELVSMHLPIPVLAWRCDGAKKGGTSRPANGG